jgi:hypothetical protein
MKNKHTHCSTIRIEAVYQGNDFEYEIDWPQWKELTPVQQWVVVDGVLAQHDWCTNDDDLEVAVFETCSSCGTSRKLFTPEASEASAETLSSAL